MQLGIAKLAPLRDFLATQWYNLWVLYYVRPVVEHRLGAIAPGQSHSPYHYTAKGIFRPRRVRRLGFELRAGNMRLLDLAAIGKISSLGSGRK